MKIIIIFLNVILVFGAYALAQENIISLKPPIGDGLHTQVYSFITEELLKAPTYDKKQIAILRKNNIRDYINKDSNNSIKPHIANLYEGETSHLLRILCKVEQNCYEITLYQKDGVGIATTGLKEDLKFKKERDVEFQIGILGNDLKNKLNTTAYQDSFGKVYEQQLYAIYMNKSDKYFYLSLKRNSTQDFLIGYVSYLVRKE